ncbi:MAG: metallopeptidase [Candidatus Aenigmatarchaeota archaeon]|nr:MAG: metallopeptidase [Candidatus Aenigmarchaeota archaeon]
MKYRRDLLAEMKVKDIIDKLGMDYVDASRVICMRSVGTTTKRTLARIHAVPKIMQKALGIRPHYIIEILNENFDKLSPEDKTRTIIHELMHIPRTFGGGFRQHGTHVTRKSVEQTYRRYVQASRGII